MIDHQTHTRQGCRLCSVRTLRYTTQQTTHATVSHATVAHATVAHATVAHATVHTQHDESQAWEWRCDTTHWVDRIPRQEARRKPRSGLSMRRGRAKRGR